MDLALVFPGVHRRGGVERSVWELARHWSPDHDVTVYSADVEPLPSSVRVVDVPASGRGPLRPWAFSRASKAAIAASGTRHDHVVSFGVGAATGAADVLWVNSVHRAWLERRGESGHSGWRQSPARRVLPHHQVLLRLEREHYDTRRRTDGRTSVTGIVTVADAVGADLQRLYGVPAGLLHTVHNGYDPTEFYPRTDEQRASARAALGLPADALVLLVVANELARKGFAVVLDAAAASAHGAQTHVVLVGRSAPDAYLDQIDSLGMSERVHYLGSRSDMGEVHAASDLFVLPTTYEAFCLAIVESLASGLPVITTTVPGAGDLIVDGVNGALQTSPKSVAELTELIRRGADPNTRTAWSEGAVRSVKHLDWASLASRGAEILAGLPVRSPH